ncbi:MAG: hypothetical protein ACI970_001494 [Myxococcota bacterium]|jgi:hypothetical protein
MTNQQRLLDVEVANQLADLTGDSAGTGKTLLPTPSDDIVGDR